MTREEALLKLLAIEPERLDRLRQITGWPPSGFEATIATLESEGRIGSHSSICNCRDYRVYFLTPEEPDGPDARRVPGLVRKARRNSRVEGPFVGRSEHPRAGAPQRVRGAAAPAHGTYEGGRR